MSINIVKKTSSTNTSSAPGRKIEYIVIHYTAGVTSKPGSAANTASWFMNPDAQASADFIVDDATIVQYNPDIENRYCWHCGGSKGYSKGGSLHGIARNTNSIGIEICSTNSTGRVTNANDSYWSYTDAVLAKAIELVKYLMEKYSINVDHVIRHYDVTGKLCPGIIGWNADTGSEAKWQAFKAKLTSGAAAPDAPADPVCTQGSAFKGMTNEQVIAAVAPMFTADQKKSGILASISMAQFILESGYGKSDLSVNANNCFGMKKSLSGNTWAGSTWDGVSVHTIQTQEQNPDGSYITITADFRKYANVEASIADHSAYLLGAMNGSKKRYDGISGMKDYKAVAQLLKDGGYATDLSYVSKLCSIIENWNLTQYDVLTGEVIPELTEGYYRVRKTWADAQSQIGAFRVYANAKNAADSHPGYAVFDPDGKEIYTTVQATEPASECPFLVKVNIPDLNIRTGAGTDHSRTGHYTGIGVFTIMEVKAGVGSTAGWGRLKSGAGWISLDYAKKI